MTGITAAAATAAPLAILLGLLCDGRMFGNQRDAFDAVVIDGLYGDTDTIGAMAGHALARLPDRCSLLGHPMGARVALEMWRCAPERIERLALADTGVHPVRDGEAEERRRLLDLARRGATAARRSRTRGCHR